jgi:hypothetical protein
MRSRFCSYLELLKKVGCGVLTKQGKAVSVGFSSYLELLKKVGYGVLTKQGKAVSVGIKPI